MPPLDVVEALGDEEDEEGEVHDDDVAEEEGEEAEGSASSCLHWCTWLSRLLLLRISKSTSRKPSCERGRAGSQASTA